MTAAVAAAAWSGIPVTHRGESVGVTLVTAHEARKAGSPQVQWRQLARLEHQTLAGYMGLATLPWVVDELLAGGMDPAMPAAMIEQGTNPGQRRVHAPLADLPRRVREAGIAAPALFLVGPSLPHSATLDWRSGLPLTGRRVAAVGVGRELCSELEAKGAQVLSLRAPLLPAAEVALRALPVTDLIVGTAADLERIRTEPSLRHTTVWCLCSAAVQRALECGIFGRVEEVPAADIAGVMTSLASLERHDGSVHEVYPKQDPVADRGAVVRRPLLQ